ncbi:MAG: hipA [Alphaproteobacteria bacterium]|jgi:hypothetical protein|nr:hipA [Alphaproteobacteria bacterium]
MANRCYKCKRSLEDTPKKHGVHPHCFQEWFALADTAEDFQRLNLERVPEENTLSHLTTSFFHGKFKKYSADLGGKKYILKMSDEYPELAKTEYLCNQIGVLLGLDIPKNYLLHFQEEQDCFVTYNFMQDFIPATLEHAWRFLKESDRYDLETLLAVVEKHTGRLTETKKFIQMCLFDALIGNHDRHGRNFGLIRTSHSYVFSPCYDNPSYFGIAEFLAASHAPRGAIATASVSDPMMKDYVEELTRLGLKGEALAFRKDLKIEKVKSFIQDSFLSEERKKAFLKFLEQSYQELIHALQD